MSEPTADHGPDTAAVSSPAGQQPLPARRGPGLAWLPGLLGLGGVVLLGLLILQQREAMETLAADSYLLLQRSTSLDERLAAAEAESERLALELRAAQDASRASAPQAQLELLRRELDALRLDVASRVADSERDWLLVEAATLLRLAQQQAVHVRNVASACSLYESADERLQRVGDPALQAVRAALQLELDALRAVAVPEVQVLYLQLGELSGQLATLAVQSAGEGPLQFIPPEHVAPSATAGWWDELKSTLGQYFVVTRRDEPVLARLTPQQVALIRQAIMLQLETARLALLQEDQQLYAAALDAAADGISQQLQGEAKTAVLASLQRLRTEPVTVTIPPLGAALQALELLAAPAPADSGVLAP